MKNLEKISLLLVPLFIIPLFFSAAAADNMDAGDDVSQGIHNSGGWGWGLSSLSDMTNKFSEQLAKEVVGRNLYVNRTTMRDMITKSVSNFSSYLQHELESSLSRHGFNIVYEPAEADYLIGATYQQDGGKVRVFFKYHKADLSGSKSQDYQIATSKLPPDSFEETINIKAYELASNILSGQRKLRVYIKPIVEGNNRYVSDFSNSFTSIVKSAIVTLHRSIEVIDEKPIYERLSNIERVKKKARIVKNLRGSDAFFVDANSVLDGKYFDRGDSVTVLLYLRDLEGAVLNSSTVDIKKSLIKSNLQNNTARRLMDLIDASTKKGDFYVKISTTKGRNYPLYYEGERIKFHLQVADPLYVHLYDVNSKGEVLLLFPYDRGSGQHKLIPGRLYTIPADADDFEIEVKSPFGMEAVKIFASSVKLPLPELTLSVPSRSYCGTKRPEDLKRRAVQKELSRMKIINPKDLVDYYRGMAEKFNISLYEDSLVLETKKR